MPCRATKTKWRGQKKIPSRQIKLLFVYYFSPKKT
jgi:hypothetical protein